MQRFPLSLATAYNKNRHRRRHASIWLPILSPFTQPENLQQGKTEKSLTTIVSAFKF